MLRKLNKLNYTTVKSYCVIGLLNFLGKVCEKEIADMLSEWCKVNHILHKGQMSSRHKRSAIDAIFRVVSRVQEA